MPVRPFIKSCNQIQFYSESHSPFSQQLDSTAVSLQPLSQHGEAHPDEHAHEPPVLHEHWFASHPQSEHVQFSPQHIHAAALEPLKVARANGVATTAPSSASPANDLINIEISFVNNKNRNKTTRRYSINEARHKESLGVCGYLSPAAQFQCDLSEIPAAYHHLQQNNLVTHDLNQRYSTLWKPPMSSAEP